jgi:hypothetical protein
MYCHVYRTRSGVSTGSFGHDLPAVAGLPGWIWARRERRAAELRPGAARRTGAAHRPPTRRVGVLPRLVRADSLGVAPPLHPPADSGQLAVPSFRMPIVRSQACRALARRLYGYYPAIAQLLHGSSKAYKAQYKLLQGSTQAAQVFFCKLLEHQTEGWGWFSMVR